MKNLFQHNSGYAKKLLYKSFDSPLTKEEDSLLKDKLEKSADFRNLRERILTIRGAVKNSANSDFNPYFEAKLFAKINQAARDNSFISSTYDSFVLSFKKIVIAAAILLLFLISYNLNSGRSGLIENLLGKGSRTTIETAYDPTVQLIGYEKQ